MIKFDERVIKNFDKTEINSVEKKNTKIKQKFKSNFSKIKIKSLMDKKINL